jgi:hypothetical protein
MIDELDAIREVHGLVGSPDEGRRSASRIELLSQIELEAGSERTAAGHSRGRRWFRLRFSVAGAGALSGVAAAVVAVLVLVLIGHGGAVQPPTAAAAVLERAAKATGMVSPLHLGPDQFWFVEDEMVTNTDQHPQRCKARCYAIHVRRWWVGANRFEFQQYETAHLAKRTTVTKAPPNLPLKGRPDSTRWSGVGGRYDLFLGYRRMLTASTDVRSLDHLVTHAQWSPRTKPPAGIAGQEVRFSTMWEILNQPRVPARMLTGLYRLLATWPGARLVGRRTDTLGRPALEIAYNYPTLPGYGTKVEWRLLFDPKTYVLLDDIVVGTGKHFVYQDIAFVRSGLVSRIGAFPKG